MKNILYYAYFKSTKNLKLEKKNFFNIIKKFKGSKELIISPLIYPSNENELCNFVIYNIRGSSNISIFMCDRKGEKRFLQLANSYLVRKINIKNSSVFSLG